MSQTQPQPEPRKLLAGRWQIPLAFVATIAAAVALYRVVPATPDLNFGALLADVRVLEEAGELHAAANAVANLLEMDPPLPEAHRAALHDRMAALIHRVERGHAAHIEANLRKLLSHARQARELGLEPTPEGTFREGMAHAWLGHVEEALALLGEASAAGLQGEVRRDALRTRVELLDARPQADRERERLLRDVLEDEAADPEYTWWALRRAVQDALARQDAALANQLLERHAGRLQTSDYRGYAEHLRALALFHEGRLDEAAPVVRWVDEWLGDASRVARTLDGSGALPQLNRWLMGRIHLAEDRPEEALREFDAVLSLEPAADLAVASTVGRGEALAALERHAEALRAFSAGVTRADAWPTYRQAAQRTLRDALLKLHRSRSDAGDTAHALAYLDLATELTKDEPAQRAELLGQLGRECQAAAERENDQETRRSYHARAGSALERAADLVLLDEVRHAALLWAAAEQYDRAGRIARMRAVLERFVAERAADPRLPVAMLQLGRAHEAYGELPEALRWYERVARDFPALAEAARAQVLAAGTLATMGRAQEAEKVLDTVLKGETFGPDAVEYRDALLLLCELLYYQERFGDAIGRLRDLLVLYPDHPDRRRASFMLADAYRRSAYALRDHATDPSQRAHALRESHDRFRLAAQHYGEVLANLERDAAPSPTAEQYRRLALFYRADCLFELNEPATLEEALAAYGNAAAYYDGQPASLTAYVQMANVYLRLGNVPEAARALERARFALGQIPETAYATQRGGGRADWESYLSVVSSTELFRNAFDRP